MGDFINFLGTILDGIIAFMVANEIAGINLFGIMATLAGLSLLAFLATIFNKGKGK